MIVLMIMMMILIMIMIFHHDCDHDHDYDHDCDYDYWTGHVAISSAQQIMITKSSPSAGPLFSGAVRKSEMS